MKLDQVYSVRSEVVEALLQLYLGSSFRPLWPNIYLSGDYALISYVFQSCANLLFTVSIHPGSVEVVDTEIECSSDDFFSFFGPQIDDPCAAKSDDRDL